MLHVDNDRTGGSGSEDRYEHHDPVTDAALDWLLQLQSAPADRPLRDRFDAWRRADARHGEAFVRLTKLWGMPELDTATNELAKADDRIVVLRQPAPSVSRSASLLRWAGAIAATILLVAGIQQYPRLMIRWQADHMTQTGEKETIDLPDGSRLTLNTASAVALDFENGKRTVSLLQGEAFFEVIHDAAHPFTVAGHFSEVEVKGTRFSVKTDDGEDLVVLQQGAVQVTQLPERLEMAYLDPGEAVTVTATSLATVQAIDTDSSLAWLEGRIVFSERPLASVIADLERYYPGRIIIADDRIGKVTVSGNYRLTDPEGTIRSLAAAAGAGVTKLPGQFLILR